MKDKTARSWPELMEALYDIPKTFHGRHRFDFVYRGLADESWGLDTSLYRLGGDYVRIERPMLRSFRTYAEPGAIPSDNFWYGSLLLNIIGCRPVCSIGRFRRGWPSTSRRLRRNTSTKTA